MLRIWFEWLEFEFECFEFGSNGYNLHSNASNAFWMVRISFKGLEFAFECFEFGLNGSNLDSKASNPSNPFRMVRISIQMLRIPFKWLEFSFEYFEHCTNATVLTTKFGVKTRALVLTWGNQQSMAHQEQGHVLLPPTLPRLHDRYSDQTNPCPLHWQIGLQSPSYTRASKVQVEL